MAGTLLRKTRKEIFSQRGKVISSLTLVFIGVFCYVAFSAMFPVMRVSLDATYETYASPDFMAVAYSVPRNHISGIEEIEGIEGFASRYHVFGDVSYTEHEHNPADIYGINPGSSPDVFKLILSEGTYLDPLNNRTILVERSFASSNGLSIGSDLTVSVFGTEFDVEVVGIVNSIEHLLPHRNPKQLINAPSRATFSSIAPIWIDISVLQEISYTGVGEKDTVNEILVRFKPGYNSSSLTSLILAEIEPYPIVTTLGVSDLRSAELQRFDIADEAIVLFSGLIFVVASFVVYTTVSRIIQSNSRAIGITKSLGYSDTAIQRAYLLWLGSLALIATLVAIPLGEPGGRALINAILLMFSMEAQTAAISPTVYLVALVVGPGSVLLAAYFPTRKITSYEPIRAIRGWMMEKGYVGETILEKMGRKIGIRGYGYKYVVRSMSLNKTRAALLIIGISLGAGVAFMGTSMVTGYNNSLASYMSQYEQWDLLVDFKEPLNSTQVETLVSPISSIENYEAYLKLGTSAIISGEEKLVSLLCINTTGSLHRFNFESGRAIENEQELLVDVTVARLIGIEVNNKLNLTLSNSTIEFTLVGIVSSPLNVFYIEFAEAMDYLNQEMISGAFVRISEGSNPDAVAEDVFALDDVENSMTQSQASSGVLSESQGSAIAIGMAGMAMTLLLAVVWNIVSISTGERTPELAQLESLGWPRNSLSRLLILEVLIVSLFGIVISVPIGYLFTGLLDNFMKTYIPFYSPSFDLAMFLSVGFLTIFTAIIASLPAVRKLRRIDIDRVIRERLMT
ncbi:ABC transporter permease [Candidatus Thorarchaeota archaeon]|nr:MAG: ABC transporter permease [Candidatus Thorarchaeota archaeon]